jgi:hypothetical protein
VISVSRLLLILASLAFAMYHAALGLLWLADYKQFGLAITALMIYLATVIPTILAYDSMKMPIAQALFNLAAAILIPLLINAQIAPELAGTYATWYVAAIATLMAATAVRQYRIISWLGVTAMVIEVIDWGGAGAITTTGVIGALILVLSGQAIATGLRTAGRDAQKFVDQAREASAQMATNTAIRTERKIRSEQVLRGALPILQKIQSQGGRLSEDEKAEALLLEAELRDEIRGRNLLNAEVRLAVRNARRRNVEVMVLDEGGLDEIEQPERDRILHDAAMALDQCEAGRVTLRSPMGESWKVTVAAMRPGAPAPDLWLRLK